MQTEWKIVFEGYWPDIYDSVRKFENRINFDNFIDQKYSFGEYSKFGCASIPAKDLSYKAKGGLSFAMEIIQATKKSVKTYLSCEMKGNGITSYACLGDDDEHVYNEIITAHFNPELTKKLRKIQGDIENIISERQE